MLLTTACVSVTNHPRLRRLKRQVHDGRYVVDPHAVAAALLARTELELAPWIAPPVTGRARTRPSGR